MRSGLRGGATFGGLPISPATPPPRAAVISGSNEATIPTSAEIASKLALSGANAGTWTGNLPAPGTGSADNSAFEILGDQLRLKIPADYESKDSYRIHLEATDPGGLTFGKSLTVQVLDANEAPSNLTLSHSQMVENQAVGSVIGAFSASDPDTNETLSYWLMGHSHPTNQLFSLQATNGVLRTASSFDFEANASSHALSVKAIDSGGASTEGNFTITLVNDASDDPFVPAPITDANFQDAVNLWFSDEANATATYGHIRDWNVSAVTNMSVAFKDRATFNEDISGWDVSSVTNMGNILLPINL